MPDEKVVPRTHHEIKLARYAWNLAIDCAARGGDADAERDLMFVKATPYRRVKLGDGSEYIYAPSRSPIRPWWINGSGLVNPKRQQDEQPLTLADYAVIVDVMQRPVEEAD